MNSATTSPSLNASSISFSVTPGTGSWPVFASMRMKLMPGGMRNGIEGLPASAFSMKWMKPGSATDAPVSFLPKVFGWS